VDVNGVDNRGTTALMSAAARSHGGVVRRLLSAGADPNLRNVAGCTALTLACRRGHAEVVTALLESGGIDKNAPDDHGFSPLCCSAWKVTNIFPARMNLKVIQPSGGRATTRSSRSWSPRRASTAHSKSPRASSRATRRSRSLAFTATSGPQ
jgi:hypothetical protein